jgi:hypothetical protein
MRDCVSAINQRAWFIRCHLPNHGRRRLVEPSKLEQGRQISKIYAAPETMLRGYFRQAAGPGWALVGDSGHFKHPATAQGICDAVEQALWIANAIQADDPDLEHYEKWRDDRAEDHYPYSFFFGTFPPDEVGDFLFGGLAGDSEATQDFLDAFARQVRATRVFRRERRERWAAQGA